jgi:hypothetical protein
VQSAAFGFGHPPGQGALDDLAERLQIPRPGDGPAEEPAEGERCLGSGVRRCGDGADHADRHGVLSAPGSGEPHQDACDRTDLADQPAGDSGAFGFRQAGEGRSGAWTLGPEQQGVHIEATGSGGLGQAQAHADQRADRLVEGEQPALGRPATTRLGVDQGVDQPAGILDPRVGLGRPEPLADEVDPFDGENLAPDRDPAQVPAEIIADAGGDDQQAVPVRRGGQVVLPRLHGPENAVLLADPNQPGLTVHRHGELRGGVAVAAVHQQEPGLVPGREHRAGA